MLDLPLLCDNLRDVNGCEGDPTRRFDHQLQHLVGQNILWWEFAVREFLCNVNYIIETEATFAVRRFFI